MDNYTSTVVRNSVSNLMQATNGNRNQALNKASYELGRLVGAGKLGFEAACALLETNGQLLGLSLSEIRSTVQSGLQSGVKNPLENKAGNGYETPVKTNASLKSELTSDEHKNLTESMVRNLENQSRNPYGAWLCKTAFCSRNHQREWNVGFDLTTGETIYYLLDSERKVINGRRFLYDGQAGKRIRKDALGRSIPGGIPVFPGRKQIPYGIWQLTANEKRPIALVESEKSALIVGRWIPKYVWIAFGSLGLKDIAEYIGSRAVTFFIDNDDASKEKARKLKVHLLQLSVVSAFSEMGQGFDVADWFVTLHKTWGDTSGGIVGEAYDTFGGFESC